LGKEEFESPKGLLAGAQRLEKAINGTHRLAALGGKTPDEFVAGYELRHLPADYDGHRRHLKLEKGYVSFIRLVRKSGRITTHAGDKFDIDPNLKWQYVLARADIKAQKLHIYHQGELIKTLDYTLSPR
jgi:hypothetical protein